MRSTIDIEIRAGPQLVFALARDVERWERLLPHYARSRRGQRPGRRPLRGQLRRAAAADRRHRARRAGHLEGQDLVRARDPAPALRARRRGDPRDGRHVADRAERRRPARGCRSSTTSGRASRSSRRSSTAPSRDRSPAGRSARSRPWPRRSQAGGIATPERTARHDRPATGVDHRARGHHRVRDRSRRVPGRAARRPVAGQADRPVRPEPVPQPGGGPGRRLRPARLDAAQDRPAARPVQPVRPGGRPPRARRRGVDPGRRAARPTRSGSGSISARRSGASPTRRSSTSATSSAGSRRSRRTWRSPCSAGRRRPTSASRSTSAGRSCRPPTRARRAPSRSARRSGTCATAGSMRRSPVAARSR